MVLRHPQSSWRICHKFSCFEILPWHGISTLSFIEELCYHLLFLNDPLWNSGLYVFGGLGDLITFITVWVDLAMYMPSVLFLGILDGCYILWRRHHLLPRWVPFTFIRTVSETVIFSSYSKRCLLYSKNDSALFIPSFSLFFQVLSGVQVCQLVPAPERGSSELSYMMFSYSRFQVNSIQALCSHLSILLQGFEMPVDHFVFLWKIKSVLMVIADCCVFWDLFACNTHIKSPVHGAGSSILQCYSW